MEGHHVVLDNSFSNHLLDRWSIGYVRCPGHRFEDRMDLICSLFRPVPGIAYYRATDPPADVTAKSRVIGHATSL